jgi:hypothetical protein
MFTISNNKTSFNYINIVVLSQFRMVEIPWWQPMFIITVKYFFVVLAMPSDDGQ